MGSHNKRVPKQGKGSVCMGFVVSVNKIKLKISKSMISNIMCNK